MSFVIQIATHDSKSRAQPLKIAHIILNARIKSLLVHWFKNKEALIVIKGWVINVRVGTRTLPYPGLVQH
jgi:hypothetical protein